MSVRVLITISEEISPEGESRLHLDVASDTDPTTLSRPIGTYPTIVASAALLDYYKSDYFQQACTVIAKNIYEMMCSENITVEDFND